MLVKYGDMNKAGKAAIAAMGDSLPQGCDMVSSTKATSPVKCCDGCYTIRPLESDTGLCANCRPPSMPRQASEISVVDWAHVRKQIQDFLINNEDEWGFKIARHAGGCFQDTRGSHTRAGVA
jgi:hypothetical protein